MVNTTLILVLIAAVMTVGCAKSSAPHVEDLVKVRPPTFNQSLSATISVPSIAYVVRGECDSTAYVTEYMIGETSWTEVPCVGDAFSFAVKVNGQIKVSARSRGKFSYSDIAHANIRFLAPPTSSAVTAVSSSKSDSTDLIGAGTQNTLGATFEGKSASNVSVKVDTYIPRVVYEQ